MQIIKALDSVEQPEDGVSRRLCAVSTCHAASRARDVDGKVRQRGMRAAGSLRSR